MGIIKKKRNILGLLMLLLFVIILFFVLNKQAALIDNYVFKTFIEKYRSDNLTILMLIISRSCSPEVLLSICVLAFIFMKNKRIPTLISVNLILVFILNTLVKIIVQRPRPIFKLITEVGYSFPSAHSIVVTAFYGYIMYIVYKHEKIKSKKILYMSLLALLMLLTGLSRMYLGVHYCSDVIAGFCLSVFYLIIYITYAPQIYNYIVKKRK